MIQIDQADIDQIAADLSFDVIRQSAAALRKGERAAAHRTPVGESGFTSDSTVVSNDGQVLVLASLFDPAGGYAGFREVQFDCFSGSIRHLITPLTLALETAVRRGLGTPSLRVVDAA